MKKVLVLLVATALLFGVAVGTAFIPEQVQAEAEFTEDDLWDVYDKVADLQNSGELPTQEKIDNVRLAVETIPEDFEIAGISRSSLLEIMDWVQARFDEGNLEVDDPAEPEVTEPEPTEPEVTEPEVTESEPEVTEPAETEPEIDEYGLPRTNESGIYLVAGLAFLAVASMGIVVRRKVK